MRFCTSIIFIVFTFGSVWSVVVYDKTQYSEICKASLFVLGFTMPQLDEVEQQKLEHSTQLYAWSLEHDDKHDCDLVEYPLSEMNGLVCGFMMRLDGNDTQQKKIHTLFVNTPEGAVNIENLLKQDEIKPGKFLYRPIEDLSILDATLTPGLSINRETAIAEANKYIINVLWKYSEVKELLQTSIAAGVAQTFFQREKVEHPGIPDGFFAIFVFYSAYLPLLPLPLLPLPL